MRNWDAIWIALGVLLQLTSRASNAWTPDNPRIRPAQSRREWTHQVSWGLLSSSSMLFPGKAMADSSSARPINNLSPPSLAEEAGLAPVTAPQAGRTFFPTLTPPFQNRATYRYDLGRNAWAFEQLLTFANVTATIRCTVVQLESTGGLWVHSPQYPTGEFMELLSDLGRPVEHIVLPCNALEHKAPMQSFVKKFPKAQVWIAPGQYGPFGSAGRSKSQGQVNMGYPVAGILGSDVPPWANEFDSATLYVDIPQNAGPVSEVAFCHRPTKTLIATDAVVYIPPSPSEIYTTYFDRASVVDDPTFWPRTVLQAVFLPLRTNESGEYPGFGALQGRLVRAPILRAFADSRAPQPVREWIDEIATWKFDRIVSSHFASPVLATPYDVKAAFAYLDEDYPSTTTTTTMPDKRSTGLPSIACEDWELLEGLNRVIADNKLGAPAIYDYKRDCI